MSPSPSPPLDDSPRALAAAFAFLDEYLPPADATICLNGAADAQESLFLQESELSALLDAQSRDMSGWADTLLGPSGGGEHPLPPPAQSEDLASTISRSDNASGSIPSSAATRPSLVAATISSSSQPTKPTKKARSYNPNRARDEQRKELARLREQAPRLEQALARLKWKARRNKRPRAVETSSSSGSSSGNGGGADDAWREVVVCRRELREQAEMENARLRVLIERQMEIATRMQQILQTIHRNQARPLRPPRPGIADQLRLDACKSDTAIFERLLAGVARSFSEVDAVLVAFGIPERPRNDQLPAASTALEISVRRVAALAPGESADGLVTSWRYFARPIANMPWRAYQRQEQEDVASDEPTVVESCGVKLCAEGAGCAADHVRQYIRKTKERGRIVIAWGSFADSDACAASDRAGVVNSPDAAFYTSRCPHSDRCFQRHQASARSDLDAVLQPRSLWGLLATHRTGEALHGGHGESLEVTARKVMPFGVRATADAAWQYFAHALEHVNYRFYYKKDAEDLDVAEDTIVEGFRLELLANGRERARFRVHQVLRRVARSGGSVVLVWRATMEPLAVGSQAVRAACFYEKGYVEVRRAPGGSEAALVQTCYLISPRWGGASPLAPRERRGLTDTVLSGTAANITASYQMIESALADEAARSLRRTTGGNPSV